MVRSWLHEIGLMADPGLMEEKRAAVARLLASHLPISIREPGARADLAVDK